MANKINKKNSRKSQKKSNKKSNVNLKKNKKVGGSEETQQVPTLAQLRDTYFDFSEVDLFKRNFLQFLTLVYGTPKKIKMHNKDDINAIKRIASGIKTQQFLLNNHLLIPKDRIYEKNNQGFLIYKNENDDDKKFYTFLKPSGKDLKHNLMRNRLYLVESDGNQNIDEFKKFVNENKINSQMLDIKINSQIFDNITGNVKKWGYNRPKFFGGVVYEGGTKVVPITTEPKFYIVKIKDLKFELNQNSDLGISNFKDFKISINNDKQVGGNFFESGQKVKKGSLLRNDEDDKDKLNNYNLLKKNKKQNELYINEHYTEDITLMPIHKKIPNREKTYTQLIHENTKMLKDFKNKSSVLNVNPKLKKYFPEEGNYKFNLNNDGMKQLEIERKLQNEKMKEFNKNLEEL